MDAEETAMTDEEMIMLVDAITVFRRKIPVSQYDTVAASTIQMLSEEDGSVKEEMQTSSEEDSSEDEETQRPSEEDELDWIFAENNTTENNRTSVNGGKWLIFENPSRIDKSWKIIRTATESGKLGNEAKVSTMKAYEERRYDAYEHGLHYKKRRLWSHHNEPEIDYVICVYTYDWTDEADVMRVREELNKLGFTGQLPYKSEADTRAGLYSDTNGTRKRISKYYC